MANIFKKYFSTESRASRLEKKLQKAIKENNQKDIISLFCKEFLFLLNKVKSDLLSNFVSTYLSKVVDFKAVEQKLSANKIFAPIKM